jgi:hypothetical protein
MSSRAHPPRGCRCPCSSSPSRPRLLDMLGDNATDAILYRALRVAHSAFGSVAMDAKADDGTK